jgi:hypothetical protein
VANRVDKQSGCGRVCDTMRQLNRQVSRDCEYPFSLPAAARSRRLRLSATAHSLWPCRLLARTFGSQPNKDGSKPFRATIWRARSVAKTLGFQPGSKTMQHSISWLAGLLEAEGSFSGGSPSQPRPFISIEMTDEDVIRQVAPLFGVNFVVQRPSRRGYQASFATRVMGARAVSLMTEIYPFMGERRRGQITVALEPIRITFCGMILWLCRAMKNIRFQLSG